MGRWFKSFFEETGHTVLVAGRTTALTCEALVQRSAVVILSVPISAAEGVCRGIGPAMDPSQLLMDICSLKEDVLKHMLENTSAQVVGTHPLFGPATEKLYGQNIIICPGRGTDGLSRMESLFRSEGAVLTRMDPQEHDRHMALVQGLTHFLTVSLGRTLQKLNLRPQDALQVATPVFRTQLDLVGRLFAQDLELFQDLIRINPYMESTLEIFLSSLTESRQKLIVTDDSSSGKNFMQGIHEFLNPFCEQGLAESNFLLNALYSNMSKK